MSLVSGYLFDSFNREEKSLRHVALVETFLDDNKPKKSLKSLFALFQISQQWNSLYKMLVKFNTYANANTFVKVDGHFQI